MREKGIYNIQLSLEKEEYNRLCAIYICDCDLFSKLLFCYFQGRTEDYPFAGVQDSFFLAKYISWLACGQREPSTTMNRSAKRHLGSEVKFDHESLVFSSCSGVVRWRGGGGQDGGFEI